MLQAGPLLEAEGNPGHAERIQAVPPHVGYGHLMTQHRVTIVSVSRPYAQFDLISELNTHVQEMARGGWELVSTESIGHGSKTGYVLFWKAIS